MPTPQKSPTVDHLSRADTVWINGDLTTAPSISTTDPGFLLGLGIFETLSFRDSVPTCFSRHYRRLQDGAAVLGIHPPKTDVLRDAIAKTASANGLEDARIRITVTGDPSAGHHHTALVTAQPLAVPEKPASAITVPIRRNPASPLCGVKSTSYAESILALRIAKTHQVDEAILCDISGNLSEAASANLFFVKSGRLYTPCLATGCLPGITRELILELCETNRLPVSVETFPPSFLTEADEAFVTSSIRGVHPLASIDACSFPSPPGPVTQKLKNWLETLLANNPDP